MDAPPSKEVPVIKRIVATLALASALALPAGVLADTTGTGTPASGTGGTSIAIQSSRVTAKLVVRLEVAVTCQPRPAPEYPVYSGWEDTTIQGDVRQASGKSIAFGSISAEFDGDTICDGAPHLLQLDVVADPAGVPFKSGSAVISATVYANSYFGNYETGESGRNRGFASTGWVATRLGK